MKKGIVKILILVLFLEVFVFNYQSYRVLSSNNKKEFNQEDFSKYETNDNYTYVEIDNLSDEIKTLNLDLGNIENVEYEFFYTDDTSSEFREIPSKNYIQNLENSKYICTYLSGKSNKIAVKIYSKNVQVDKIAINNKIPFNFNLARFIILFLIVFFIYCIKKCDFFEEPYYEENYKQLITVFLVMMSFVFLTSYINLRSRNVIETDYYETDFVDSLSNGKVYLEEKPSEKLTNLEKPYDTTQRDENSLKRGKDYIWDASYYNGKYYSYFGILPAIILLMPYHLLTGKYMLISMAILIFSLLTIWSLKELIINIYERYFKNTPFKIMIFSMLILLFGSQILILNGRPKFYELAVISGLFFATAGINFLLMGIKEKDIKYKYIFLSSLFLSFSVACRPTMLFASLIALPVFIKIFIKNFKEKRNIGKSIVSICVPYILIGSLLMYYNYIRFNSIFEFGASYQLTVNDMSSLKNRIMTIGTGIVCNLFGMPSFTSSFPFIETNKNILTFYGYYYIEDMIGGLFILTPICFAIFSLRNLWKKSENKEVCYAILTFSGIGLILCIVSIMMAGSLQRYLIDYGWMLIIAGIMSFVELRNVYKTDEGKHLLDKILKVLVIYIVVVNLCTGIRAEKNYFKNFSTEQFYKLRYSVDFWE